MTKVLIDIHCNPSPVSTRKFDDTDVNTDIHSDEIDVVDSELVYLNLIDDLFHCYPKSAFLAYPYQLSSASIWKQQEWVRNSQNTTELSVEGNDAQNLNQPKYKRPF